MVIGSTGSVRQDFFLDSPSSASPVSSAVPSLSTVSSLMVGGLICTVCMEFGDGGGNSPCPPDAILAGDGGSSCSCSSGIVIGEMEACERRTSSGVLGVRGVFGVFGGSKAGSRCSWSGSVI